MSKSKDLRTREELLQTIESLRARVDELQASNTELERLRATDPLTGVWNRSQFDRAVALEIDRSIRFRQPLSLLLIDIDHFKKVNDTLGHQTGDAVLKSLAAILNAGIRLIDGLYRWGGEEFAILVSSTSYQQAGVLAEKLRERVEKSTARDLCSITVSIGVAEHRSSESPQDWFERVDAALYRAKLEGRNRVAVDPKGDSDLWEGSSNKPAVRLVWKPSYECGNALIDAEHQLLFDLANQTFDASFGSGNDAGELDRALDKLLEHIATHFRHEEQLLAEHHYDRLASHRKSHAALLGRAMELKASVAGGKASIGDLVEFLANKVVAQHLMTADADYFSLFGNDPNPVC